MIDRMIQLSLMPCKARYLGDFSAAAQMNSGYYSGEVLGASSGQGKLRLEERQRTRQSKCRDWLRARLA